MCNFDWFYVLFPHVFTFLGGAVFMVALLLLYDITRSPKP